MARPTCEHIDAVRHAARAQAVGLRACGGEEPELVCSACGVNRVVPRAAEPPAPEPPGSPDPGRGPPHE